MSLPVKEGKNSDIYQINYTMTIVLEPFVVAGVAAAGSPPEYVSEHGELVYKNCSCTLRRISSTFQTDRVSV